MQFTNSRDLLARARKVIPSATQTFSKGPNQWPRNVGPNYLTRGEGAWVWDADGNKFLDYLMALGPIILGYGVDEVNAAVAEQLTRGSVFSQMHPLEVEVAELLVDVIPCAEMVRFGKSGSDATTAAVRAARAVTGREQIVLCGYHGWHDWYIGTTTRDSGVPAEVARLSHSIPYNDIEALNRKFSENPGSIAAVIMEPVGVVAPEPGYLRAVKDTAHRHGALLIFDEVVTGFRFSLGGGQEYFGVEPDIACFGKAMANGMPLSAVVGRRDVMKVFDEIFYSGTFGGETLSLAAAKATIGILRRTDALARLHKHGDEVLTLFRNLIDAHGLNGVVTPVGLAPRFVLDFAGDDDLAKRTRKTYFMQECARRGLLFCGVSVPCAAHGEAELAFAKGVYAEVFGLFARAHQANDFAERLEGPPIEPVFRQP